MNDKRKFFIIKVCGSCVDFEYYFILIFVIFLMEVIYFWLWINIKLNIILNKKNGLEIRMNCNKIFN